MPAAAARSRNAAISVSAWFVGRQVLGLCVKTCRLSQPIATPRSTALEMPPAAET